MQSQQVHDISILIDINYNIELFLIIIHFAQCRILTF